MQSPIDRLVERWATRLWQRRATYVRHFVTGFVFGVVFSAGPFGG